MVFCITGLGGSYLEGLIHRGAYFQKFMVTWEWILVALYKPNNQSFAQEYPDECIFSMKQPYETSLF